MPRYRTCPLRGNEVEVLDILPECLDILVYGVGGHAADLDEPVVLDEYGVAGQIACNVSVENF